MMTVPMDSSLAPSSPELAQQLYEENVELENQLRKLAKSKIPSDPKIWRRIRDNYEAIILADHDFSEKHEIEYFLWLGHYRKIEEYRARINSATSSGLAASQGGKNNGHMERIKRIKSAFKDFLSNTTIFYHELLLKIGSKYGLPMGFFSEGFENQIIPPKDEKRTTELKKGLVSCHRCLIYLGDLARYKGLYGEGESSNREYATASSYYKQAASLNPSSGNPHHQLAILASYYGDELLSIYRYFRSLAVDIPFSTARDNLIIVFEKNRQSYSQLSSNTKVTSAKMLPTRSAGKGRGRVGTKLQSKDANTEPAPQEHNIHEIFKAFCTRFVRLNGILFTRTSLETFGEVFSAVISDLLNLLSSGPEEVLNFGSDAAENAVVIVRFIAILIFSVHNVKRESDGQSYAEIVQRTVLLQNAFTTAFEFAGNLLKRCIDLRDIASCVCLPAVLVYIEWLASHPEMAVGSDVEENQAKARSFFWNQCVLFLNKLILTGLASVDGDDDVSCFYDMSRYDEGETGNRLALWEDFELRGFSPLVPAQVILDFSRKHTFGSDDGIMEKRARIQRILAAGRALMNVVQINQLRIYFDPYTKKFVLSEVPPTFEVPVLTESSTQPNSTVVEQEAQVEGTIHLGLQSKAQLYLEGDEDEVIVFKPMAADKLPFVTSAPTASGLIQPVQSSAAGWATNGPPLSAAPIVDQLSTFPNASLPLYISPDTSKWLLEPEAFLSSGLKNFDIAENGLSEKMLQRGSSDFQPFSFSLQIPVSASQNNTGMLWHQLKPAEVTVPSVLDSIVPPEAMTDSSYMKLMEPLPIPSRKNPVSRPVRHSGPPPGFSHVPVKHLVDFSYSGKKDQQPQIDDYTWLDDYQPSSTRVSTRNYTNHMGLVYPNVGATGSDAFNSATALSYPMIQVSDLNNQVVDGKKWQDFQLFEMTKPYQGKQIQQENLQHGQLAENQPAQSFWSSPFFV